jgi:plastocyanin
MTWRGALTVILVAQCCAFAQDLTFRGKVEVIHRSRQVTGNANVVLWLTPLASSEAASKPAPPVRLVQKDKKFSPHVVAVRSGTEIEFPNQDPFFHDVISIYHGKPFDLGLYESGTSRKVRFSNPGVSYIFLQHPSGNECSRGSRADTIFHRHFRRWIFPDPPPASRTLQNTNLVRAGLRFRNGFLHPGVRFRLRGCATGADSPCIRHCD